MSDQLASAELSYASSVNCMNQIPSAEQGILGASPLAHVGLPEIAEAQTGSAASVTMTELALRTHLVLRGSIANTGFTQGVKKVLGIELPDTLQMASLGGLSIRWISPDEWLVVAPQTAGFELEQALINTLQGHCAIVNVTGGQTLLRLSGSDVTKVLQKSVPLDIHPRSFAVGKVVTTLFAKTQAVISRHGEDQWELVIRRSFADYVWLWLQDSCAEFDLVIKQDKQLAE